MGVELTIRHATDFVLAAKVKIVVGRITDGPTATAFCQRGDVLAFFERDFEFFGKFKRLLARLRAAGRKWSPWSTETQRTRLLCAISGGTFAGAYGFDA